MSTALLIALMIGTPCISEAVWLGFASARDAAIARYEIGEALNLEDAGHAIRVLGWFFSGMMLMALLVMPFIDGAFL